MKAAIRTLREPPDTTAGGGGRRRGGYAAACAPGGELAPAGHDAGDRRAASDRTGGARPATDALDSAAALSLLERSRERTHALVAHLSTGELERVHSPIMGPLVWDLAHIAAYEDLWLCHHHGGLELLRPELADRYDAAATPRAVRGESAAGLLQPAAAREYMDAVRGRTRRVLAAVGVGDGRRLELVLRHELQHTETMRQAMAIAGLLPAGEPPALTTGAGGGRPEWVEVPAGPFQMGAGPDGFAYDNERPRHEVAVAAFAIAREPLTNAAWQRFVADGGYERPEHWSNAGWAWRERQRSLPDDDLARQVPDGCLCHVSFFEAEALARAAGARLPTEAEWEKASAAGALGAAGLVWEWTSSELDGYPGFRADPYPEYSQVFFGRGYRVLRGGSWATSQRVASPTFRNWDLPERRQIFAGARLARELQ